jgi:DNA repair protein RecN (Recombination protein N)
MLTELRIHNFAIIDQLELRFGPGLIILTGETGAGKSILVGAVGLLVGGRASADLVRTGEESAAVEAIFDTPSGGEMIIRREVSAQGRSRASVDGALATSTSLRELCGGLVDLHGQHEHQPLEWLRNVPPSPARSRRFSTSGPNVTGCSQVNARRPHAQIS